MSCGTRSEIRFGISTTWCCFHQKTDEAFILCGAERRVASEMHCGASGGVINIFNNDPLQKIHRSSNYNQPLLCVSVAVTSSSAEKKQQPGETYSSYIIRMYICFNYCEHFFRNKRREWEKAELCGPKWSINHEVSYSSRFWWVDQVDLWAGGSYEVASHMLMTNTWRPVSRTAQTLIISNLLNDKVHTSNPDWKSWSTECKF